MPNKTTISDDTDPNRGMDSDPSWIKFLKIGSRPNAMTFPELPDIIVFFRMIIALGYGVSLGQRDQVGGIGLMFGINCITFIPIMYLNFVLCANIDSYTSINFTGLPNAIALMLLVWIFMFTLAHEEEELALTTAMMKDAIVKTASSAMTDDAADSTTTIPASPMDTEF